MTVNSVTAVLSTWHALKLSWQQRISHHRSDSLLPTHWKTISLNSAKLFSFYITNEYLVSLLWKPLHHLLVYFGILGSETAHFCTFCRHMLARKNSRRVSSPASHRTKSIISSNFRVVFYSFSSRDNFYLESHSIRRAACFWHDEKNNSDERDTWLKRLSGYSNWEYCCVSAIAYLHLRFFLLCLLSFCLHWAISQCFWGSLTQMAGYNQEFRSRSIADGFAFSFGQYESVRRYLTFRVLP